MFPQRYYQLKTKCLAFLRCLTLSQYDLVTLVTDHSSQSNLCANVCSPIKVLYWTFYLTNSMSRFFLLNLHHRIVVTVCFQMSRVVLMLKMIEIMTRDMYIPTITYHRTRYVIAGIYYWKIYMDLYFCKQGLFFCVITDFLH